MTMSCWEALPLTLCAGVGRVMAWLKELAREEYDCVAVASEGVGTDTWEGL
jgi:hypothetical protein